MSGIKAFLKNHVRFFSVLLFLLFYELVIVRNCAVWEVGTVGYAYLALDYSLGFASTILPGEVFRFLFGETDPLKAALFTAAVYLAVLIAVSAFVEKLVLSVEKEERRNLWLLLLFFIMGPCTFSIFFTEIGVLEIYWLPIAALFFLVLKYKALLPLAAPLCVLALLVNWNALICIVPFFCILLLYRLSLETEKKARVLLAVSFAVCVIVSVPVAAYLLFCVPGNMKYSLDEFHDLMIARGVSFFNYTDTYLYRTAGRYSNAYFESIPDALELQRSGFWPYLAAVVKAYVSIVVDNLDTRTPLRSIGAVIAVAPVVFLIQRFFFGRIRNRELPFLKRFSSFCMSAMFFVTLLITLFTSFDYYKWLSYAFLFLFSSFLYVLYREKEAGAAYLNSVFSAVPLPFCAVYLIAYAAVILHVYY